MKTLCNGRSVICNKVQLAMIILTVINMQYVMSDTLLSPHGCSSGALD